jgi:sec-independent protein translocase protein TatC
VPEPKYNREDHLKAIEQGREFSAEGQDLTEHLNELRNRILISLAVFFIFAVLSFIYSEILIKFLEQPAPIGVKFFQLKPGEIFLTTLKLSGFMGIVFALPVILMQVKAFMEPGLKDQEKKILAPIVNFSPPLFWLGIAFGYILVLPALLEFLMNYGANVVEQSYSLDYYLSLVLSILCICGISFQIPTILITLAQLGLVTSKALVKPWRYVILASFIVAAIITPTPDPFTMSILAGALLALYFLTLLFMQLMRK